jgi:hypothetical protein
MIHSLIEEIVALWLQQECKVDAIKALYFVEASLNMLPHSADRHSVRALRLLSILNLHVDRRTTPRTH